MDKGELVPDKVTIDMLGQEVMLHPEARGFIFDGFPRTTQQAQALDQLLHSMGSSISCMLALEVPEDELRKRLLQRGSTSGREDDRDPAVIQHRIDVYQRETAPVAEYYRSQGKYRGIHGVGEIPVISNRLFEAIDEVTPS